MTLKSFIVCTVLVYLDLYYLPVGCALDLLVLHNLNPISIGIQDKCNVVHPPVGQALLEVDVECLEAVARGLEVIHRDTWLGLASSQIMRGVCHLQM